MTRGSRKAHIVRAAEESIAYQIKDVLELMIGESGINLKELRVDGGPTRDNFLMQFQSDILGIPVERNSISEISSMGSAFMAGLAIGFWNSKEEIKGLRNSDRVFVSKMDIKERQRLYQGWRDAVKRTLTNYLATN
jgi:glycerol kinase